MGDPVDALVLDLLERAYREVIEAWKTSCPRLPVWEEANARGYLEQHAVLASLLLLPWAGRNDDVHQFN